MEQFEIVYEFVSVVIIMFVSKNMFISPSPRPFPKKSQNNENLLNYTSSTL